MAIFNLNNERARNLADPIYDKDAVNLRTARNLLRDFTGTTEFTASAITATTYSVIDSIKFEEPATLPDAEPGVMFFSASTLFIYSGSSISDLVALF